MIKHLYFLLAESGRAKRHNSNVTTIYGLNKFPKVNEERSEEKNFLLKDEKIAEQEKLLG